MLRKSIKITIKLTAVISILVMLSVVTFFVWVAMEPRSLSFITPYIEKEISAISPKFNVKIDSSSIAWDTKQRAIAIHARNVNFMNDTNDNIATLPEISFGFSLLRFLQGKMLSSDLTIFRPSVHVDTSNKTLYVTPESDASFQGVAFTSVYDALRNNKIFKINSIRIKDADIFISTGVLDMVWKISEGYAKIENEQGSNTIKSEFTVNFGNDTAYFMLNVASTREKFIDAELTFKDLPSYPLDDIFPDYQIDKIMKMSFSGKSAILIAEDGKISQVQINLDKTHGKISLPEIFEFPIEIQNLKLNANAYEGFSKLGIDNMELDLHGPTIKISGDITNTKAWPEIMPNIDIATSITNFTMEDVGHYWPYKLGAISHDWVVKHITDGVVPQAQGRFKFSAEDIQNIIEWAQLEEKPATPPIPDDAIAASIHIEKGKVHYLPDFPEAMDVKAIVKFTGHSMDAIIESAKILSSNISKAHVKFDDLWHQPLKIGISGDFSGNAKDAIPFIKASYAGHKATPEMELIYNITGDADGHIDLTIPIKHNLVYDDINIKISSHLKNASLPGIVNGKDLSSGNFDMDLNKYDLNVKGNSIINKIPTNFDLYKNLSTDAKYKMKLKVNGSFSPEEIKALSGTEIPFINGEIGVNVNINIKDNATEIEGTADLLQSSFNVADIGLNKEIGKAATATFNILDAKNHIKINSFELQGEGLLLSGNATMVSQSHELLELSLKKAIFGRNSFILNYKSSATTSSIDISGTSLDLSNAKLKEWTKSNDDVKKAFHLEARLDSLYMQNGEVLNEFASTLNCSAQMCLAGSLYSKIRNDNFVVASLKNIGDRSALLVESDNAGTITKALNISKNIVGGHLNIDASLGRRDGGTVAQGVVKISNFTAVKTPILGKLLTLASFRGIVDLLENEGINFKKFEAPFSLSGGVIKIVEGKTSGSSIGITTEGTIDTNKDEIDLKGVIVPAQAVNKMLEKIPVIGNIVTGGANEGVLATRYSIKGPYDNTKASVNPLSILTPGFLRNVFDIFD